MARTAKKAAKSRRILSAAAALGGKMSKSIIRLPITNVYMDGDYTGTIYVGSQKRPVKVILDTGSSTLAVDGTFYDPTKDKTAKITDIAQEVGYEDGSSWVGAVVLTDIVAGIGNQSLLLPQVHAGPHHPAEIYLQSDPVGKKDLRRALFHPTGSRRLGRQ